MKEVCNSQTSKDVIPTLALKKVEYQILVEKEIKIQVKNQCSMEEPDKMVDVVMMQDKDASFFEMTLLKIS